MVLSLLTERPMHGYELNQELERREVQDWAGVSRPQVYYSLKKLADRGYVHPVAPGSDDPALGPEKATFASSAAGRRALAGALARPDWAVQRPPPPFLTWLALSTHAGKPVVRQQVRRRRGFLEQELAKERATLKAIKADSGEMVKVAALMVTLTVRQFESELAWLKDVENELAL